MTTILKLTAGSTLLPVDEAPMSQISLDTHKRNTDWCFVN